MEVLEETSRGRKRKYRPDRLDYLDQLIIEFQTTKSKDAREQVLANLANFAYDPQNYNYFRKLNVLDLFLDNLSGQDETLIKFSIGGLCNLCLDPFNKNYVNKNGLKKIISLLEHKNEDILLSTITTMMFLITPESNLDIINTATINTIFRLSNSKNLRVKHVAGIFLKDYCPQEQVVMCVSESNSAETSVKNS